MWFIVSYNKCDTLDDFSINQYDTFFAKLNINARIYINLAKSTKCK
jgi:hypothetical protein